MDIIKLLTREEPIAGLEISDDFLRLAFLKQKTPDKNDFSIELLAEEPLREKTIVNGTIQNQTLFLKSLKNLFSKNKQKIKCVVISLPANIAYSKTFSFPQNIGKEKLKNTMDLTIGFQLPIKSEDSYFDWEKIKNPLMNEVILSAAPKIVINSYLESLNSIGIKTIAVELSQSSILRAANIGNSPFILKIDSKKNTGIFVIKNGVSAFNRIIPKDIIPEKSIDKEIKKISEFYASQNGQIEEILEFNELNFIPELDSKMKAKKDAKKWIASLGAAMRGLIPRSDDNLISIMPISTEESYKYQRASIFAEFILNTTVGISIFFIAIFLGGWIFMSMINREMSAQINSQFSFSLPPDAYDLESKAQKTNDMLFAINSISNDIPKWSIVFEELKSRTIQNIHISNLLIPSPEGIYAINGTAKTRDLLNLFKKSLEESAIFTDVNLPLTNIEQKENIPFSITLKMKDYQILYK